MKYVCLGYMDPKKWVTMSEGERNVFIDGCFDYDDELRKNGRFAGGEALQGPQNAVTLRYENGKVSITDGPYAETKEQFGGYYVIDAKDLDEALAFAGRIPGMGSRAIEIRPILDFRT